MVPKFQFIKNYKNFDIFLRLPGFESIQIAFGKVALFIARSGDVIEAFAFAYPGLDNFRNNTINEVELLKKAEDEIEKFIDAKKIKNNQEYTFEYKDRSYHEVPNAAWWVKTVK